MQNYIRDTVFGHFVRWISRKRFLKFPDEVNPSLWKHLLQKERNGDAGKTPNISASGNLASSGSEKQEIPSGENGKDVYLVDWHSLDDSEV